MKTKFWMDTNIYIECIGGEMYALNGWNGEKYLHCWKCIDEWTADPDNREYEIGVVYDWSKWNEEDGEFQDTEGNSIDGIIGFEVL